MGQRGVGSQQYQLIARATYLPKGYLVAIATYLPKGYLVAAATYLRCATVSVGRHVDLSRQASGSPSLGSGFASGIS